MTFKPKKQFLFVLKTIIFWFVAFMFYDVFRRMGLSDEVGVVLLEEPLTRLENLELTFIISSITGFFYSIIELAFENQFLKRKSLGSRILIKTTSYFLLINLITITAIDQVNRFLTTPLEYTYQELITSGAVLSFVIYFVVCSILFSLFRIINEKFGTGVLKDMLLGKYRNPRVEKKIFMFLDLKSSTTLAEQMGYLKYSELIQQCFYDLNEIIQKYDAQIYQYVGDEAVIFWDYEAGLKMNRCVDCYFAFRHKLLKRKDFYEERFGVVPQFKAGIHGGELVVTEVGVVKKEIAFHGDVINTSARIQAECTNFEEELLISGTIQNKIKINETFTYSFIGEVLLKGKQKAVEIYSLRNKN